jgi:hypothetical protein
MSPSAMEDVTAGFDHDADFVEVVIAGFIAVGAERMEGSNVGLIWGFGTTEAEALADAHKWTDGTSDDEDFDLHPATAQALEAVRQCGSNARVELDPWENVMCVRGEFDKE